MTWSVEDGFAVDGAAAEPPDIVDVSDPDPPDMVEVSDPDPLGVVDGPDPDVPWALATEPLAATMNKIGAM